MTKTKSKLLPIGAISEGTLRPQDLIDAYLNALDGIRLSRKERIQAGAVRHRHEVRDYDAFAGSQDADYDLDDLACIIEAHCLPYTALGSSAGDGACIGVWPDWDQIEDAGEVGRGDCLPSASIIPWDYWLQVNDHGNATLWRKSGNRWVHVWSVV